MVQTLGLVVALCAGCGDPQEPRGLRIAIPDPIVDLGVSDGCARFQVRFDAGGAPIVEPIFNSASCALNQIRLLSDTAATFNATTGALRVAIVMENLGTAAIVPRVQLRFNADSVTRLDANGNPVGGANDIVGYQPDSASANGRIAFWLFDGYLAPAGQPQVLLPGARTQRRWVEFRGTTWSHRTRLKLFATGQEVGSVPAIAPDTVPRALIAASPIVKPAQGLSYRRGLLVLRFKLGTALSERTAAITAVTGTVVGGYRDPTAEGGAYLVRLPADTTETTSTQALAILRARTSVRHVERYLLLPVGPTYVRPNDAGNWTRQSWRPIGDSLLMPNARVDSWAIQYARAPLAWGCSTGDATSVVGVIDHGLRTSVPDLPNSYVVARKANLVGDQLRHGTQVLSVMAAIGGNAQRMTGLAWQSRFALADPSDVDALSRPVLDTLGRRTSSVAEVLAMIGALADTGARIINISLGADTVRTLNLADSIQVRQIRELAGEVKTILTFAGRTPPLIVVSAGNVPQGDPRESIFPLLRDSLPNHVIIVAAMKRDSTLHRAPLGSPYVDIVAPGDSVWAIDDLGAGPWSGASFATPIVAGVASLVNAFDPRIPNDSLRALILAGADSSGRRVGGYRVVDAYWALKLAARRNGAPICGNRMWSDGNQLLVRRGTATEVIGTSTLLDPNSESYHGGRVAAIGGTRFVWQPTSLWAAGTLPAGSVPSGAWRSSVGASHDGDSSVYTTIAPVPVGGGSFDVIVDHFAGASLLSSRAVTSGNAGANVPVFAHVAYPTIGNTALVSVARGPTIVPPLPTPFVAALDAGTAYGLSLSTGQVSTLWVESGRGILFLGYSEDGSEIVSLVSSAYSGYGQPFVGIPSCKVTWRKVSAPAVVIDSASTPYGCQIDPIAGARTGGSAPRIIPRRP